MVGYVLDYFAARAKPYGIGNCQKKEPRHISFTITPLTGDRKSPLAKAVISYAYDNSRRQNQLKTSIYFIKSQKHTLCTPI